PLARACAINLPISSPCRGTSSLFAPAAWRCSPQSAALASLISSRFPREDAAADYKCHHSQNEDRELHLFHRVFSVARYYRGCRIPGRPTAYWAKYFCDTGFAISAPADDGGAVSSLNLGPLNGGPFSFVSG